MYAAKVVVLEEDGDLADQVERAVAGLRPRPEVLRCDEYEQVSALLASDGPVDVLIAGPSMGHTLGLEQLRQFRIHTPDTSLILAFDRLVGGLRATVRTGAFDILRLPVKDELLTDAVEEALDLECERREARQEQERLLHDRPGATKAGGGTTIAVISAAGGCGKTFFATNLAYELQTQAGSRTCLVDLDLQFGEVSSALRMKPALNIADLVATANREDGDMAQRLEEHVAVHETGVSILAGPDDPVAAESIDAGDIGLVLDAARTRYDHVIIDTSASLCEAVLVAVERADRIFAIATLDLPSIRNLGVLLSTLAALKVPSERIQLVLNKVEPDVGIDVAQIKKYFPQGFSIVVPYGREVNRALNMGSPVLAYAPGADVSKILEKGLTKVMAISEGTHEADRPSRRLFRRNRPAA